MTTTATEAPHAPKAAETTGTAAGLATAEVTDGPRIVVTDVLDIPLDDEQSSGLYRCAFKTKVDNESNRCGAQSFYRITLAGGELYSCCHHYAEHRDALHRVALEVHDQSNALNSAASVSATI